MRLASRTSVISVVFHLPSLMRLAVSIHDQIQAALGAFEINTASICCQLHTGLSKEDEAALHEQCAPCTPNDTEANRNILQASPRCRIPSGRCLRHREPTWRGMVVQVRGACKSIQRGGLFAFHRKSSPSPRSGSPHRAIFRRCLRLEFAWSRRG
jgi:hypothetical protein